MNSTAWTAVGAIAAAATFFTYVAILIYAVKQVREAQRLRFETERLRRSQWRPFVVVDVEPGWILYLTIENIGTTLARNVQFSFTPTLASTVDRPWEFENSPLLRDGVATFPPRKRYRIFFDGIQERLSRGDLPMKYAVRVTYEDDDGNSYDDGYTLDLNAFVNTSPDEKGIPDLVKELETIRKALDKWTDGARGLPVHTQDKDDLDRRTRARADEWRARQIEKSGEAGGG